MSSFAEQYRQFQQDGYDPELDGGQPSTPGDVLGREQELLVELHGLLVGALDPYLERVDRRNAIDVLIRRLQALDHDLAYEDEAPADGAEPDRAAEFERGRRNASQP